MRQASPIPSSTTDERGSRVEGYRIETPGTFKPSLSTQNFFRASSPNEGMPRMLLDK
jgi:hypothetical protein